MRGRLCAVAFALEVAERDVMERFKGFGGV